MRYRAAAVVIATTLLTSLAFGQAAAPPQPQSKGRIADVIVYRGQALVTRLVDVPGPLGLKEMLVTELPEQVVPGSIYAESADGVEVRSVSYRIRPVQEDVRDEVRQLDGQIVDVQDKLTALERRRKVLAEQTQYLGRLSQFAATTSASDLTKGVLNAETLQKLTVFQFEQGEKIAAEELKLTVEQRTLGEQLSTLQRQRNQIASSSSKLAREAIVFVNLTRPAGQMRVRYLVNNATWTPSYNVRADSTKQQIAIEYLASVQQLSGEDWDNVAMTLSTATPSLVAKAPTLTELTIALGPAVSLGDKQLGEVRAVLKDNTYAQALVKLRSERAQLENQRAVAGNGGNNDTPQLAQVDARTGINGIANNAQQSGADFDTTLNRAAGNLQLLDLLTDEKISRGRITAGKRAVAAADDEGLSVSYKVGASTSLPSRSDRQLIQIASLPVKAEFYKIATPVLTRFVYNEARVTNDTQTVMLAGPVATYVDSQFVGQSALPSVSAGESFTVGLGIDSSLRAGRELVEKTDATQGGNAIANFTYRIAVENFGPNPVSVRVLDRLPVGDENQVKVSLVKADADPAKAPRETTGGHKGLLRWDLAVPAHATGENTKTLEYQFRLEYDKQMTLAGLPVKH